MWRWFQRYFRFCRINYRTADSVILRTLLIKVFPDMLNTKRMRFPLDIILVCIRWYAAYPLSYRHIEEIMEERGVFVDHSSINRWAIRFLPLLEKASRKQKRPVGGSWRMDESVLQLSCIKDEGRPLGIALQEEVSNHHKLH